MEFKTKPLIWVGPRFTNKGASAAQNQLATEQANFYQTLTDTFSKQFASFAGIAQNLVNQFLPILNAGPTQTGVAPAAEAAMQTQATDTIAQQTQNAVTAQKDSAAAQGGGDAFIPSGAQEQIEAGIRTSGAAQQAAAKNALVQQDYAIGNANWKTAAQELGAVASLDNPTAYAGAATGAGSSAFNAATTIAQENNAADPWNIVTGLLGGAVTAGLDSFTGGIGGGLAKQIFGSGGGTPDTGTGYSFFPGSGGGGGGLPTPCWIAAAVFGEDFNTGPRVNLVRRWLVEEYEPRGIFSRAIMSLYRAFGKSIAALVKKSRVFKFGFTALFNHILHAAEIQYGLAFSFRT